MSRDNVETVRAIFEQWQNGEFTTADWADPDLEFIPATGEGTHRGIGAMRSSWRSFLGAWQDFRVEAKEIVDAGDQVLALTEFDGVGRGSGVSVERMRGASVFTFRDGKVARLALYTSWAQGLAAMGLEERP